MTATRPAPAVVPYGTLLRQQQRADGDKRKGERTRDTLILAAAKLLERDGYLTLRVRDICQRAHVTNGTFYLYFRNTEEIAVEVLTGFLRSIFLHTPPAAAGTPRPLFEALYHANLAWVTAARANAGLMRCMLQLNGHVPEFHALHERLSAEWFARVSASLMRRTKSSRTDESTLLLAVHVLGAMMDEVARKLFADGSPQLEALLADIAPSDEALAEFLSTLWYRALFGADPPRVKHRASRRLLRVGKDNAALTV
jgi:TetR/AcrR family transcriptional regulator, transcriptional repressor for nem operon